MAANPSPDNTKPSYDELLDQRDELLADKSRLEFQLNQEKLKNKPLQEEVEQLRKRNARLEGEREAYGDIMEKIVDKITDKLGDR